MLYRLLTSTVLQLGVICTEIRGLPVCLQLRPHTIRTQLQFRCRAMKVDAPEPQRWFLSRVRALQCILHNAGELEWLLIRRSPRR